MNLNQYSYPGKTIRDEIRNPEYFEEIESLEDQEFTSPDDVPPSLVQGGTDHPALSHLESEVYQAILEIRNELEYERGK
jgi:hypothetical protein